MGYDLKGKVAIITGAARGQGAAEAALLASWGATVYVCDVLKDDVDMTVRRLVADQLDVRGFQLDVTRPEHWNTLLETVEADGGRLDILVNNAGIVNRSLISNTSIDDWDRVLRVNVTGAFLGIQKCAPLMQNARRGSIINISSNSAFSGHYDPAYTASKWALRGLTKTAAAEYVDFGIRVNAVCPGLIITDLNKTSPHVAPFVDITPMKRSGTVEDVAALVGFLASDASGFITGEDFVIDGGFISTGAYRSVAERSGNVLVRDGA